MSESFFSRWSRQKRAASETRPAPPASELSPDLPPERPRDAGLGMAGQTPVPTAASNPPTLAQTPAQTPDAAAMPTLDDVKALTPESDFQPFMQRGVGTEVRNAAMKKLFADPHFNVMDGLDIYIDDYSQPDPMPAGMLRRMASAQFLGLVPREAPGRQADPVPTPALNPTSADGMEVVAQSPDSSAAADTQPHDNPDLQLQPDPAPADPQPGSGPR